MRIYHGAKSKFREPDWELKLKQEKEDPNNRNPRDYGKGFYLCESKEEAESWAMRATKTPGSVTGEVKEGVGWLMQYQLNISNIRFIEISYDEPGVYALFLLYNRDSSPKQIAYINSIVSDDDKRRYNEIVGSFDVLCGPRLDSDYLHVTTMFMNGKLSLEEFAEEIAADGMDKQIYLATEAGYKALKCEGVYTLNNIVKARMFRRKHNAIRDKFWEKYEGRL